MLIVNLTQHPATPEQIAAGVTDLAGEQREALLAALTFDEMPDSAEIHSRAELLAELACHADIDEYGDAIPQAAMIGGAPYLMGALEASLKARAVQPLYAFTRRVSTETAGPSGEVVKTNVFRHEGFVPA